MANYPITVYASPMWNPGNGKDITTYLNTTGAIARTFTFSGGDAETELIYFGVFRNSGSIQRKRINTINVNLNISVACLYYYIEDNVAYLKLRADVDPYNNLVYSKVYTDTFNQSINTWTSTETSSNVTSVNFNKTDSSDNAIINLNIPYLPIFDDEDLVTAYLADPDDESIYSQAINYYDSTRYSQPHYELRNYYRKAYNNINSIVNEIFKTENCNYTNFISNILNQIDRQVKSLKNTVNYNAPIEENEQKVKDNLTQIVKLQNMELVDNPSGNAVQINFPNKAPFVPSLYYCPFDQEDLDILITRMNIEHNGYEYYFLFIKSEGTDINGKYYNVSAWPYWNTATSSGTTYNYANLLLRKNDGSKQEAKYYLNNDNSNSINLTLNYFADFLKTAKYYINTKTITDVSSVSINANMPSSATSCGIKFYRNNYIVLNDCNINVPFYCKDDVYVAYQNENGTWENSLWLKKDDNYQIDLSTVAGVNAALKHVKPVIMLYNRYQFSFLNGWDGNKMEMGDYYLIAPQLGAGIKESDNSFSGVVMGTKLKDINRSDERLMGIFGQNHGRQSFFLNSDDGSAIFGLEKQGQITLDPTQNKAMIYSGNYWNEYKYDGKPANYYNSNRSGQGMLIDLTTPEIRFGNGNFVVDADGNTSIAGGGGLAGWKITDTTIQSGIPISNGRLVLDSGATCTGVDTQGNKTYTYGQAKIYSGLHNTLVSTAAGFYLSDDGLSIGPSFKINATGTFYIGYNSTTFDCEHLDDPVNYKIGNNTTYAASVYVGMDGIRLGKKFAVDDEGNMAINNLIVTCPQNDAVGCWIGKWQFAGDSSSTNLSATAVNGSKWDRIWFSSAGLIKAEKWNVQPTPSGQEGRDYEVMWAINPDGTATFKGNVTMPKLSSFSTPSGNVTLDDTNGIVATSCDIEGGTIGGFTISTNLLSGSSASISANKVGGSEGRFVTLYINGTQFNPSNYATSGTKYGTCDLSTGQVTITI